MRRVPIHHLSQDKTIMTYGLLPRMGSRNDPDWDKVFTVNYIHQFLYGEAIPIEGVRYNENVAHSIEELVAEYLKENNKRIISGKGILYYLKAADSYLPLKPEIILNQGSTSQSDGSFSRNNFLLTEGTYNAFNSFTIEYAKSLWLTLFDEYYRQNN